METLIAARGSEIKFVLPKPEVKNDGTIWMQGIPLLGIDDPAEKKIYTAAVKAKKFSSIPAKYFTKLGDNENGLWVGTREEWQKQPGKIAHEIEEQKKAIERKKIVSIYLSSRGWGDFSALEWNGNITRPEAEILAECRNLLEKGHDVDKTNQTDAELLTVIREAKHKHEERPAREAANKKAEQEDLQKKIDSGFCFYCETWCHGDCGHYSKNPQVKFVRDFKTAQKESNYGIND